MPCCSRKAVSFAKKASLVHFSRGEHQNLLAHYQIRHLPAGAVAADLRRRRRLQRLSDPVMENPARPPRRRDRAGHHRLPPAARNIQMEEDRAPAVLAHLDELARLATQEP